MDYIKKNWIKILVAVVVLLVVVRIFAAVKTQGTMETKGPASILKPRFKCEPEKADKNKKLRKGTRNSNEVCYLQEWLNRWFNAELTVDGDFGAKTESALIKAKNMAFGSLNDFGA